MPKTFRDDLFGWLDDAGSKKRYSLEYDSLYTWVLESIDAVKYQLSPLFFPLFCLSYITLISQGYTDEAISFKNKHRYSHTGRIFLNS